MATKQTKQARANLVQAKTRLANSRKPVIRANGQEKHIQKIGVDCIISGWHRSGVGGTPSARNSMLGAYGLL